MFCFSKKFAGLLFLGLLIFPTMLFSQSLHSEIGKELKEKYGKAFFFDAILTMEKVGDEHFASEISIQGKGTLRIPIKLHHSKEGWKVNWLPKKEYLFALNNLSTSKALFSGLTKKWTAEKRLPTFPIILSGKRMITPFGEIEEEVEPVKHPELGQHGRRWINEFLEQDPAPASFEIITTKDRKWASVHQVMFQMAGVLGLFQMYLIGASDEAMTSLKVRTSVGTKMPTRILSLSLDGKNLRLKTKEGQILKSFHQECLNAECSDFSTFLPQVMGALFKRPLEEKERIIIGFSSDVKLGQAMHLVSALMQKLDIKSERFLVTLVEE